MAPFSKKKKRVQRHWQNDETMERFQMGPTYLSLVYKHPQYKVEGCWSYTERMILAVTGPFFSFWMPTLPTEFELLWRNANCSRHVLIFCNWNSETLLELWMATVMAVVLYHSLTYLLTQSQQKYWGVKELSLIVRFLIRYSMSKIFQFLSNFQVNEFCSIKKIL